MITLVNWIGLWRSCFVFVFSEGKFMATLTLHLCMFKFGCVLAMVLDVQQFFIEYRMRHD